MAVLPHRHEDYDPINTRSTIPGARIITARTCGAKQMELWEQYMPPGGVIPLHYHDCEESLTFLSGEVEVILGEERTGWEPIRRCLCRRASFTRCAMWGRGRCA